MHGATQDLRSGFGERTTFVDHLQQLLQTLASDIEPRLNDYSVRRWIPARRPLLEGLHTEFPDLKAKGLFDLAPKAEEQVSLTPCDSPFARDQK